MGVVLHRQGSIPLRARNPSRACESYALIYPTRFPNKTDVQGEVVYPVFLLVGKTQTLHETRQQAPWYHDLLLSPPPLPALPSPTSASTSGTGPIVPNSVGVLTRSIEGESFTLTWPGICFVHTHRVSYFLRAFALFYPQAIRIFDALIVVSLSNEGIPVRWPLSVVMNLKEEYA